MASMEQKSPSSEPKHTTGHSTTVVIVSDGSFMCPECGKTFSAKDAAEAHLHSVHLEHLRNVHGEFHSEDVVGQHVE